MDSLHKLLPLWLRQLFTPLFQWIYPQAQHFASPPDAPVHLQLAYLGMNRARARLWASRICGDDPVELPGKRIWLWQLEAHLAKHARDCQIVLIETCTLTEVLLARKRGCKVPMWIQLALDTTRTLEQLKRASKRLRDEIPRVIRKYSLTLEVCRDASELDTFIDTMHVPFIRGRHRDNAFLVARENIHKLFDTSELLYIVKDGMKIAGVLLQYEGQVSSLHYVGVKDNNVEYLKYGCIGALYYFSLLRSLEKGVKSMHFGGTSPFLTDSLTFFKLSFRPVVIPNTYLADHFVKVILRKPSPALTAFLQSHPFVSVSGKAGFTRNLFIDAARITAPAELEAELNRFPCGNLDRTVLHVTGDVKAIQRLLPETTAGGHISCVSFSSTDKQRVAP